MNYERVAATLQQRISELVARYEGDLAMLREDATKQIETLTFERDEANRKISELEESLEELTLAVNKKESKRG